MKRRPLTPDDERHGTYAGAVAHWHANIPMCNPCADAQYATNKRSKHNRDHGKPGLVPLGQAAWNKLNNCTRTQMWHATNLNRNMLTRLHKAGPEQNVHRSTRDAILTAQIPFTPIGIQRRLQALAAIGYSSQAIAEHVGVHPSTLNNLRRHPDPKFVRDNLARRIVNTYNALHMRPVNTPRAAAGQRTLTEQRGWLAPLAWDDIDFDSTPAAAVETGIDEVKIQRVLNGIKQDCTTAERIAVIDGWQRSYSQLERITGWNVSRILNEKKVAA